MPIEPNHLLQGHPVKFDKRTRRWYWYYDPNADNVDGSIGSLLSADDDEDADEGPPPELGSRVREFSAAKNIEPIFVLLSQQRRQWLPLGSIGSGGDVPGALGGWLVL